MPRILPALSRSDGRAASNLPSMMLDPAQGGDALYAALVDDSREAWQRLSDTASLPILTTREIFYLKARPALAAEWTRADSAARTAILTREAPAIAATKLDPAVFGGKPVASETVEWFASPRGMARTLDRLRAGDDATRAILATNPGTDAATAARFAYVGFKGGSETGVVTLNFLVRRKDGRWLAIAAGWHRNDAGVEDNRFIMLMTRALVLMADAPIPG